MENLFTIFRPWWLQLVVAVAVNRNQEYFQLRTGWCWVLGPCYSIYSPDTHLGETRKQIADTGE